VTASGDDPVVRLTRIYTRGGDRGQTSLGDGSRVAKCDLRVETFGTVDEANATLGLARLHVPEDVDGVLARVQNELFDLGADLCRPGTGGNRLRVTDGQVARLEAEIDRFNAELDPLSSFVLPGGSAASAHLHLARTVVRRAERLAVALSAREPVDPTAIRYLNRLSDLLFVLARWCNDRGRADVLWKPGATRAG
jgi:cob(I)alamin adenosyltransferase